MSSNKRNGIFDAAVAVFERVGYRGATLEDIALEAGVSKSLIFYHYDSKYELLELLYERVGALLIQTLDPIMASDLNPEEKLRRIIRSHVDIAVQHQAILRIYMRERHEIAVKEHDRLIGDGERGYVDKLEGVIREGVSRGDFFAAHPRVAAYSILGACNWLAFWYRKRRRKDGGLSVAQISRSIEDQMLNGLVRRS